MPNIEKTELLKYILSDIKLYVLGLYDKYNFNKNDIRSSIDYYPNILISDPINKGYVNEIHSIELICISTNNTYVSKYPNVNVTIYANGAIILQHDRVGNIKTPNIFSIIKGIIKDGISSSRKY